MNFKFTAASVTILATFAIAGSVMADQVPENNHPMGYYAEVQTDENPAAVPQDENGQPAEVDENGQTIQVTPKANLRMRAARLAPDNLNPNNTNLPNKDAVDISDWQRQLTQADFNKFKAYGVKTVIIKLTESTNYKSPSARDQIAKAKAAGLQIATYHFSHFSESSTTSQAQVNANAIKEANFYASTAKALGLPTNTIMINDAEYAPNGKPTWDWTQASQVFANQLRANGYTTTRHYMSRSWTEYGTGQMRSNTLGANNFWIAQYLYGTPSKDNLQNTNFGAWQYSSQMYFGLSNNGAVDVSVDYKGIFNPTNITPPKPAPSQGYTNIYRLYNTRSMEHLYTTSSYESDSLANAHGDWQYEGVAWQSPTSNKSGQVFRVYNPNSGEHLYTMSNYEANVLSSQYGWRREGVAFNSNDKSGMPIYRLYNPAAGVGAHFQTSSAYERDQLVKTAGWKYEGIAYYGKK